MGTVLPELNLKITGKQVPGDLEGQSPCDRFPRPQCITDGLWAGLMSELKNDGWSSPSLLRQADPTHTCDMSSDAAICSPPLQPVIGQDVLLNGGP